MDYNNYQPIYEQPHQPGVTPADIQQKVNDAFGKALAAVIMAGFPVASIIGMVFGNKALKMVMETLDYCTTLGIAAPGKLKTAKILGTIGKWLGLGSTILWALFIVFYALYLFFIIFAVVLSSF